MMTERPILFSAPMVQAIQAGAKTQTRRIIKPQFAPDSFPVEMPATDERGFVVSGHSGRWWCEAAANPEQALRCPYGKPGDRLWVREAHSVRVRSEDSSDGVARVWYRADSDWANDHRVRWTPSIHMPRLASRINLLITGVRVERLQDISRGDAMAEGCPFPNMAAGDDPRQWFASLWQQINGPDSWAGNPWVWVVEFKRSKKLVDT